MRKIPVWKAVFHFGFIVFILCCPLFLFAEEARTWQDDTGLFSIEATLEQIVGDAVRLKRADDGRVITLPISRLSEADRRYIASLAAQNPFEGGAPSAAPLRRPLSAGLPGTGLPGAGLPGAGVNVQQSTTFPSFANLEVRAVDLSRTREAGGNVPNVWVCEPNPAPPRNYPAEVVRLAFRNQDVPVNVMPRRAGFFVAPTGYSAVVASHVDMDRPRRDASRNYTRIFLGCTVSGETMFQDSPLKLYPHGFSADVTRFAFHQDTWAFPATGQRTLLHIAEVTPSGWTAVATFEPFAQLRRVESRVVGSEADIFGVTWVDNEHLIVQSGRDTAILLNIDTGEAVWRTRIEGRGDIALSPGRKYLFLPIGNRAVLLETLTGRAVGAVNDAGAQRFRFSPNGKRFATCTEQGIILGDVATGVMDAPFYVPGSARGQEVVWLDDRFLLLRSNGSVIDTESKAVVWTYNGLREVQLVGGRSWCIFDRMREGSFLTPLTLPHPALLSRERTADGEAELALHPGVNVSLVIEDSIVEDRDEIREIIKKKIAANGWVLADTASILITLSMSEKEEQATAGYTTSRFPMMPVPRPPIPPVPTFSPMHQGGTTVEFQPERYDLVISDRESGTRLWRSTHTTTPPQWIALDEIRDASLQEVVDKAMEAHNYKEWLEGILIPRTISRPQERRGESRVTENGIEDIARR